MYTVDIEIKGNMSLTIETHTLFHPVLVVEEIEFC
jgi:hypothetical protein